MRVSASELSYVGGDHWAAILDGIADLKDHLGSSSSRSAPPHALLLYGCPPASRDEILAALPPKPVVDRYISHYFNHMNMAPYAFWTSPSPIVWVGLLFTIICVAVLASDPEHPLVDVCREKAVQCLVLGEYTRSGPYVLETMYHYVHIEFFTRADADKDVWFLMGLAVSLAKRMGYHRDPRHFPGISPLQGEMRRRLWAAVLQGDILFSSQMGVPRIISDWQHDTAEPRNLVDADLEGAELPPRRPETELTLLTMARLFIRHMLYKGQVMLHRRFLGEPGDAYAYSRRACLDASLGTLHIQRVLEDETGPGGQLHSMRWRVSTIMTHQFLTATMILCSLLLRRQTEREAELVAALRTAREIWMRSSAVSRDASRAAETVSLVLARAEGRDMAPSDIPPEDVPTAFDMGLYGPDRLPGLDQSMDTGLDEWIGGW